MEEFVAGVIIIGFSVWSLIQCGKENTNIKAAYRMAESDIHDKTETNKAA